MDYIICYITGTGKSIWEGVNGEDAMHIRVSELCDSGLDSADIMVFPITAEIDANQSQVEKCEITRHILDIVDCAVALAGYKVLDGDKDTVCVRHQDSRRHFEIKVNELID